MESRRTKKVDWKTRKLLTMHKGLQPKSDVERLYESRKEEARGLMSCESAIRSEENNLGWYLKNSFENLLQGVKHVGIPKFRERERESFSKKGCVKLLNEKRLEN